MKKQGTIIISILIFLLGLVFVLSCLFCEERITNNRIEDVYSNIVVSGTGNFSIEKESNKTYHYVEFSVLNNSDENIVISILGGENYNGFMSLEAGWDYEYFIESHTKNNIIGVFVLNKKYTEKHLLDSIHRGNIKYLCKIEDVDELIIGKTE